MLALWKKSLREARWLLLGAGLALFAFLWLQVWMVGQVPTEDFRSMLKFRPAFAEKISPVPWDELATTLGRLAAAFNVPLVVLILTVWSIGRGSDAVAGEVGRGTMELLLAQPVRRIAVLAVQATVTLLGAAILTACVWLGTTVGIATVTLEDPVRASDFAPAVLNLLALAVFLAGASTLVSSMSRYRGRVIGVMSALYIFSTAAEIVSKVSEKWEWLSHFTFFAAYEPVPLVLYKERSWSFFVYDPTGHLLLGGLGYSGILLGLGVVAYLLAAAIFCHRDLPAPL